MTQEDEKTNYKQINFEKQRGKIFLHYDFYSKQELHAFWSQVFQ